MTDKKIIDVTKCIHFNKSDISNGCTCYWDGECNHFCYFKQLKRKEQECEELKKELQAQRAFTTQEQRKIYCVAYDETCKTGNDCKQEKCIFKDNIKLKQALAEIKEICNSVENIENINSLYDAKLSGMYLQAHKILQKISEVEND